MLRFFVNDQMSLAFMLRLYNQQLKKGKQIPIIFNTIKRNSGTTQRI